MVVNVDSSETVNRVRDYYDKTHKWYKWFYIDRTSLGIHYGLWNGAGTKSEALENQYREIARLLQPIRGDLILDGGCGVGGGSLWLAQNTPAKYIGVTISQAQLQDANNHAIARNTERRAVFCGMNYFKLGFKPESLDKAFGIESFCHSYPVPSQLFSELWRVLKTGGRLVMTDGVLLRQPMNSFEQKLADNFCKGFCMAGWCTISEIMAEMRKSGFINIEFLDKTNEIEPTVRELFWLGIQSLPFHVLRLSGRISKLESDTTVALFAQKKMYELGLFGYGIFYAEKPRI